ncbi:hypothetical protein HU200_030183 [Digitaria exilis]|uniref:Uncharacterized protein n=1 Tax=Digitaria exilis TaxID=1010633 RepID=A0A835BPK5_9POAL|nr:hypothetical protein HU200_030183 [Digitaria exilis]
MPRTIVFCVPAVKRAPLPALLSPNAAAASSKMTRPSSAPDLAVLSASRPRPPPDRKLARPTPPPPQQQHRGSLAPHGASRPRPPSTPVKNGGAPPQPRGQSDPSLRRPSALAARNGKPASFMAPRGAQTVRPARRLAPGTAVYVRTAFRPRNINCRILLWLPARVVSTYDAYHLTVKYAADLNDMFAGKIVSKPVEDVRVAPQRAAAKAEPGKVDTKALSTSLSRQ